MTYTIEEIKKMLGEITYWPVMEIGAKLIQFNCHQIISELVEELESKTATAEEWYQRGVGTKHYFEKRLRDHEKLIAAAKEALQHLDFSEQREDLQKLLREALG